MVTQGTWHSGSASEATLALAGRRPISGRRAHSCFLLQGCTNTLTAPWGSWAPRPLHQRGTGAERHPGACVVSVQLRTAGPPEAGFILLFLLPSLSPGLTESAPRPLSVRRGIRASLPPPPPPAPAHACPLWSLHPHKLSSLAQPPPRAIKTKTLGSQVRNVTTFSKGKFSVSTVRRPGNSTGCTPGCKDVTSCYH